MLVPLFQLFARHAAEQSRAWLSASLERPFSADAFAADFAAAGRKVGKEPVSPTADEASTLREHGVAVAVEKWSRDELARAILLLHAAQTVADLVPLVESCFRQGDNRERQAVLKALPLLSQPERHLAIAVEACRTNVLPVFEAIACENPYPAAHFPDSSFHQMVLKALFLGVSLSRIEGLDRRWTAELERMALDFASERRAAGRPVPADVELLVRSRT